MNAEPLSPPTLLPLWPEGKMPGQSVNEPEGVRPPRGDNVLAITNISHPTLTLFPAPAARLPGAAMLVCPGGGYGIVAYDLEGTEIAAWLNSLGITAAVLKYRVPGNRDGAFQDVQRAMRLMRAHAQDWKIDPGRLGSIGFSAGGHLCARLSTNGREDAYPRIDATDALDCRPNFVILVYPAYLDDKKGGVAPELKISADVPPTLIVHSEDDHTFVPGSKVYHAALDAAKIPNEFLLYPTGGHGYGLRGKKEAKVWPEAAKEWLTALGVFK